MASQDQTDGTPPDAGSGRVDRTEGRSIIESVEGIEGANEISVELVQGLLNNVAQEPSLVLLDVGRTEEDRETRSIQNILALIAGSTLNSITLRGFEMDTLDSSDSSGASSDLESLFWPNRKKSNAEQAKPTPSDEQLEKLKEDDFCLLTTRALGPSIHGISLPKLLAQRDVGCAGSRSSRNFSSGLKCQISDQFLPNERYLLARYKQKVFCGSYSDDGDLFLSACQDQHLRIYDTSGGQFNEINTIRARNVGWSVLDTVLSPDKRHLIYSSWCDSIHQVEVLSEREDDNHQALQLTASDESRFCIFSLRFSQDGDEILGGANDGCLYLYDRISMCQSMKIVAHDDDVNAVAFVDTPTHVVASGGDDGLCKIWDRRALRESNPVPVGILAGHLDGLTYIDPRGDGRYLLTNSKDQSIKLWDLRKFSSSQAVEETKKAVCSQNWDYRWQNVPRHLHRRPREISEDTSVMTYRGHSILQTLIRCHFSPAHTTSQKFIYTGCASGSVVVYDALTGKIARNLVGHRSCVRDVSWHPFQPEIVSASWDFTLARWTYSEDLGDSIFPRSTKNRLTNSNVENSKRRKCLVRHKSPTNE